ncbi:YbaB/EbfC family nucleoid-associated protein [Asanoa sp. NPDC050611]|uniref:YbaB/EbfC family nucleoid-associated protein n=1 Tax=Asanoa sp. NPDC050611 TaxID=3157098 RepID=UPI0033D4D04A
MPAGDLRDTVEALRQAVTAATATVSTADGAVEVTAGPGNAIVGLGFGRAAYRYSPERLGALVVDTARQATAEATGTITEAIGKIGQGDGHPHDQGAGHAHRHDHGAGHAHDHGLGRGYGERHAHDNRQGEGQDRRHGEGHDRRHGEGHHQPHDNGYGKNRPELPGLLGGVLPEVPAPEQPTLDDLPEDGPPDPEAHRANELLRRLRDESQEQLRGYARLRDELADLTATARSADGGITARVRAGGELLAVHIGTDQLQHDPATLAGIVHTTVMTATAQAAMLMADRVQQLTGPRLDVRSLIETYQNPDPDERRG